MRCVNGLAKLLEKTARAVWQITLSRPIDKEELARRDLEQFSIKTDKLRICCMAMNVGEFTGRSTVSKRVLYTLGHNASRVRKVKYC